VNPCPFCGSSRLEIINCQGYCEPYESVVVCLGCGARGPTSDPYDQMLPDDGTGFRAQPQNLVEIMDRLAETSWNRRHTE
jgi:hypothetical protein